MDKNKVYTLFKIFSGIVLCFGCLPAAAQEAVAASPETMTGDEQFTRYVLWVFLGVIIAVLLFFISTVNDLLKAVIETQLAAAKKESPEAVARLMKIAERPSLWKRLLQRLTASKPIETENDILLDHEYDGIKELDNHLPPWWKWGFYLSILYAFIYVINYHIVPIYNSGLSQTAEFEEENKQAEIALVEYRKKAADKVDETNVILLTDAESLGKGKDKFKELCTACHGDFAQGGIGPNLTDRFWLHGGDVKSVFTTIKYGVADKGMISWKDEIKPSEMQAVASYILSLQGSNPAGAKEPQGELYIAKPDSLQTDTLTKNAAGITARL